MVDANLTKIYWFFVSDTKALPKVVLSSELTAGRGRRKQRCRRD